MMAFCHFFVFILAALLGISSPTCIGRCNTLKFPDGFLFGTGSSAHQIEGAWNVSDKSENVYDHQTHTVPGFVIDGSNADVACDFYHKYKEDVQLIKQLNVNFFRFSLSWSRILPTGYPNVVSKDGVAFYNNLINELIKNNIMPVVTIYHWDHPQLFQEMGGWTNDAMVELYADYARVVFREFGDRVKIFTTLNEPGNVCKYTYNLAFGLGKYGEYLCATNMLKAHARAYHIYNNEFRYRQNGKIGLVMNTNHFYPKYQGDQLSVEVAYQFQFDIYAHPIYSREGDFPPIVKKRIAENSAFEGLARSRLPVLTKEWIEYIRGTYDYLGLNHYTSSLVEPAPRSNKTVYEDDEGVIFSFDPSWPSTFSPWLKVVPEGLLENLRRIKKTYNNVPVIVTENGVSDDGSSLKDPHRMQYLYEYMKNLLSAINDYGCNVIGYSVWTFMDNFEWIQGYTVKFGLYHVDFNHPNLTRTPKESVHWLKRVFKARELLPVPKKYYSRH